MKSQGVRTVAKLKQTTPKFSAGVFLDMTLIRSPGFMDLNLVSVFPTKVLKTRLNASNDILINHAYFN
jgi:hypothetical protein